MNYENRVTIFIDILGFKEIIKGTVDSEGNGVEEKIDFLNRTMLSMREILNIDKPDEHFAKSKQITQFSDSIVISFNANEESEIYFTLTEIKNLIINLALSNIICRGGIAYGKLIHNDKVLFGPAMVEAYETESKAAMYPRVVLDSTIIHLAYQHHGQHHSATDEVDAFKDVINIDGDGMFYIDYFGSAQSELNDPIYDMPIYINKLIEIYSLGIGRAKSPDVKVKFSWMKSKINEMIDYYKKQDYIDAQPDEFLKQYFSSLNRIE